MILKNRRPPSLSQPPNLGCSCAPGLNGIWDDIKAGGASLLAQGQAKAVEAAQPYVTKVNEGLDKLDMALKIIIALSAVAALTGVINLKRKR